MNSNRRTVFEAEAAGPISKLQYFRRRVREHAPSWTVALIGGGVWGAAMAVSASTNLIVDGWAIHYKIGYVAALFGLGGALSFTLAFWFASWLTRERRWESRFAAAIICFTFATIGVTACLYALDYRQYYAHWHADAFSTTWTLQLIVTAAVSFVQFAVSGVRLYFPLGFLALIVAAIWFARHPR